MKKLILSYITIAISANVYAQSTLITPGNQENKNSGPDLILTSIGVPELRGQRSSGTLAVPTATTNGSNLLQINGFGHNGTVFSLSSRISFLTSEDWSSTAKGTDILFSSTKNGTTSTSEKMRITGDGYVGIGTTSPLTKLNVAGGNWDLATTNGDFAIGNSTYKLKFGVATSGAGAGDARIYTTGGTNRTILGSNATDILAITPTGVGVGTITPTTGFQIEGTTSNQTELNINAPSTAIPQLSFTRAAGTLIAPIATSRASSLGLINFNGYNGSSYETSSSIRSLTTEAWSASGRGSYLSFYTTNAGTNTFSERLRIDDSGNVGIGTTSPSQKLSIADGSIVLQTFTTDKVLIQSSGTASGGTITMSASNGNNSLFIRASDAVNKAGEIMFYDPTTTLKTMELDGDFGGTGKSRIIVDELQITGGSDLAEYFKVDASMKVEAGTVLSVMSDGSAKLQIAEKAYDSKVVGVVSGANGVSPGLMLQQKGVETVDGDYPIAITGRVYVKADATKNPIKAGDLLTTSDMKGYAMKVKSYKKAQGAIIGKALTDLYEGTGMVLVLLGVK